MSIKSQKSLNEECSEIFEKSYSVRSLSEESITGDDGDRLARELLGRLSPGALSGLRRRFRRAGARCAAAAASADRMEEALCEAAQREGVLFTRRDAHPAGALSLDEEGFVNAIDEIFGRHRYSAHARQLCLALDPLRSGRVLWRALLCRLVPARAPRHRPARTDRAARLPHAPRDCIVKLVSVEREGTFCYVAVSRGGRAGVYSGHLQLLHTYEVFQQRAVARRRVRNCWVTDAVYMSDAACVAYATSERCVRVFAAPTPTHTPLHCITSLPDLPTCLAYAPSAAWAGGSTLAVGTARGSVCTLRFLRPRAALLQLATDAPSYCSWTELCSGGQRAYCAARASPAHAHAHAHAARRVMCERDARRVLSCSHDAACSLRVRHASQHLDDYLFKVQRGISCFHVVWALQLVATGSCDGVVRLWELTQRSAYASLACAGAAPLLDVAILAHREIVVAFHNNCTLNIWDLHEECLIQSIKINFPFLGVLGKKMEFGAYCIHPGPARKESTEDVSPDNSSRRGSQVYRGTTGGLLLEEDQDVLNGYSRDLKSDPEYVRFNRSELLITCCDYVCCVTLGGGGDGGAVLPPPRDTLRARRPSYWELPEDFISNTEHIPATESAARCQPLEPRDLNRLLESAGLQGLLEKDFVLMQGLKNDLNKKLNDMKININAGGWAVRCGAPHLALRPLSPAAPRAPRGSLADYCAGLTLKFPLPSLVPTPSGSAGSSPAHSRAGKL